MTRKAFEGAVTGKTQDQIPGPPEPPPSEPRWATEVGLPDARVWAEVAAELAE